MTNFNEETLVEFLIRAKMRIPFGGISYKGKISEYSGFDWQCLIDKNGMSFVKHNEKVEDVDINARAKESSYVIQEFLNDPSCEQNIKKIIKTKFALFGITLS
jgi:hypothetical protein